MKLQLANRLRALKSYRLGNLWGPMNRRRSKSPSTEPTSQPAPAIALPPRRTKKLFGSSLPAGYAPPVRIAVAGMLIAATVVAILGIAHVARRQQVIRLGYELSKATEDLSRKQEENRRLRLEKATLTDPDRIRGLAESLGMTQPGPEQIRVLHDSSPSAHRTASERPSAR